MSYELTSLFWLSYNPDHEDGFYVLISIKFKFIGTSLEKTNVRSIDT